MSVARINIKNIDYFKYKKLVIDGNRDDYLSCSKEVKLLCDCVQTLKFRDEEFDDETDRSRFEEVCNYYRDILASKRIDPTDMRIKSGWWGDHKNSYSAGKLKPLVLKEVLITKAMEWERRRGTADAQITAMMEKIEGPGIYVFKHKEHQCFQSIGRADKVFARVAERLKLAFEGQLTEPLSALLMISSMPDWEFYFIPVGDKDNQRLLRILENDLILKHDCIWPHGLNFCLHIDSLLEVSEFRKSCQRHHWPPEADGVVEEELNLDKLRKQVHTTNQTLIVKNGDEPGSGASSAASTPNRPRASASKPTIQDLYDELDESASMISTQTYTLDMPGMSAPHDVTKIPTVECIQEDPEPPSRERTPTRSAGGRSPKPGLDLEPNRDRTPTRSAAGRSPRPGSGAAKRDPSGGTPRKTQSRLMKRPTTPKTRPKSDGSNQMSLLPLSMTSERSGSVESIDTKTVIISRSGSVGSVDGNENEAPAPSSPSRKGQGRPSRLQRPTSSSKLRPDSLRLATSNKPR